MGSICLVGGMGYGRKSSVWGSRCYFGCTVSTEIEVGAYFSSFFIVLLGLFEIYRATNLCLRGFN